MTEEREGKWARKVERFFDQRVDRIKRARPRLAVRRLWWYHKRIGRLVIYERIKRRKCLVWQAGVFALYRERIRVPLSLVWDSIGRDVDKNSSYAYIRPARNQLTSPKLEAVHRLRQIFKIVFRRSFLLLLFLFFLTRSCRSDHSEVELCFQLFRSISFSLIHFHLRARFMDVAYF